MRRPLQRNEANNPDAHGQARKANGEAIALDAVPSPQQAPDDQGHDHDRDGDACRNLQASAVFVPAPLLEDTAQEVSESAQQAEAARCLRQGKQEKRTRQSRPDQCVGAWQAVVLGRRQATTLHRPNRQGTVSAAARKTSSVIAAVFDRNKIARNLVPN
jgi:hypothetical protein